MSSITADGKTLWAGVTEKMDPKISAQIDRGLESIITGYTKSHLDVGAAAPSFSLTSHTGETVTSDALYSGKLVLFFYRGVWCPFCNLQLKGYADELDRLREKGAELVAISPESPDFSAESASRNNVNFDILFDKDNTLAKAFGVAIDVPDEHVELLKSSGTILAERHGSTQWELPHPAVFVIEGGRVTQVLLDPNYRNRAEVEDILAVL